MAPPSFPPEELRQIVQEVATLLKERKETISVAETVSRLPQSSNFSFWHSEFNHVKFTGSRWTDLGSAPLLPRRFNLLPRRPNPLHARVAHCIRRLDARNDIFVQRPHALHRLRPCRAHAQHTRQHLHRWRERNGWAYGRQHSQPDAGVCGSCSGALSWYDGDARGGDCEFRTRSEHGGFCARGAEVAEGCDQGGGGGQAVIRTAFFS